MNVLLPHPLAGGGTAAVNIFFGMAAFLSFHSFEKMYIVHKDNAKSFTKAFLLKWVKRFF